MSALYRSVHLSRRDDLVLLAISLSVSVGCVSHERYVLDRTVAEQIGTATAGTTTGPAPEVPEYVSAVREKDRRPVFVKTASLQKETLTPLGTDSFRIEARGINRLITAGSILTWVGTAISLAGTAIVAVGKLQDNTPLFYAGGITALAAEPLMWTGTGLWIGGAMRLPFEVRPASTTAR